jgi:hypothetical protein
MTDGFGLLRSILKDAHGFNEIQNAREALEDAKRKFTEPFRTVIACTVPEQRAALMDSRSTTPVVGPVSGCTYDCFWETTAGSGGQVFVLIAYAMNATSVAFALLLENLRDDFSFIDSEILLDPGFGAYSASNSGPQCCDVIVALNGLVQFSLSGGTLVLSGMAHGQTSPARRMAERLDMQKFLSGGSKVHSGRIACGQVLEASFSATQSFASQYEVLAFERARSPLDEVNWLNEHPFLAVRAVCGVLPEQVVEPEMLRSACQRAAEFATKLVKSL